MNTCIFTKSFLFFLLFYSLFNFTFVYTTTTVNVAFILTSGKDENNWSGRTFEGIQEAKTSLAGEGINMNSVIFDNRDPDESTRSLMTTLCNSVDLIIVNSNEFGDLTAEVSESTQACKDTKFGQWSATKSLISSTRPNFKIFAVRGFMRNYLAGYLCSQITETGEIGFVSPNEEIESAQHYIRDANSLHIGVKSQNPSHKINLVSTSFWYAPVESKWAADLLLEKYVDCVHSLQSSTTVNNVFLSEGKYVIGWGAKPELDNNGVSSTPSWVVSAFVRWRVLIEEHVRGIAQGNWEAIDDFFLPIDGLDFSEFASNSPVPIAVQNSFNTLKESVFDGSFNPYCGSLVSAISNQEECVDPLEWEGLPEEILYDVGDRVKSIQGNCDIDESFYWSTRGVKGKIERGNGIQTATVTVKGYWGDSTVAVGDRELSVSGRERLRFFVSEDVSSVSIGGDKCVQTVSRKPYWSKKFKVSKTASTQIGYLAIDEANCVFDTSAIGDTGGTFEINLDNGFVDTLTIYGDYAFTDDNDYVELHVKTH